MHALKFMKQLVRGVLFNFLQGLVQHMSKAPSTHARSGPKLKVAPSWYLTLHI